MLRAVKERLAALVSNQVLWDCPLKGYTSFAIGGPAAALITVRDVAELQRLLILCGEEGVGWRIIGKGTNLLVSDAGYDGVILILGKSFSELSRESSGDNGKALVRAGAACSLARLGNWCGQEGLSGLEFTAGIPGTVGGAVVMNAGAWGRELADVLVAVTVMSLSGKVRTLARSELAFGYRIWHDYYHLPEELAGDDAGTSRIAGGRPVVVGVELQCVPGDRAEIELRCQSYREKRQTRQPKGEPNAGSFFKNPEGDAAGRLIEASGLKGLRVGGAMVSPVHANFLVNVGGATAADVLTLMKRVQSRVEADSGVVLEPEVHFL